MTELRRSPLDAQHRALGARMVGFGGWEMPVSYPSGTLSEHRACRERAVAFDVSHLGTVLVTGEGAFDRLQSSLTNDLRKIGPGRAQYTHLLDADDASVVDDIIVWWVAPEEFHVMPNASNTDRVVDALGGTDITASRAVVAVQGPTARLKVNSVAPDASEVEHFAVERVTWDGIECLVAGTGYTGEDGIEVAVPAEHAGRLWDALLDSGVEPAGLGARDTLRLEAGLPLHGHELGPAITPLQAGLGWVVGWDKGDFRGRAPLAAEKDRGVTRRLRGLTFQGRQPGREGSTVLLGDAEVGTVTSGNFSPVLGHAIAMAFLPPDIKPGVDVDVDVRGRRVRATVTKLPFVSKKG